MFVRRGNGSLAIAQNKLIGLKDLDTLRDFEEGLRKISFVGQQRFTLRKAKFSKLPTALDEVNARLEIHENGDGTFNE